MSEGHFSGWGIGRHAAPFGKRQVRDAANSTGLRYRQRCAGQVGHGTEGQDDPIPISTPTTLVPSIVCGNMQIAILEEEVETFVYRNRAYGSAQALWRIGRTEITRARRIQSFGPPPKVLFRVMGRGEDVFLVDPVEVRRHTAKHPQSSVEIMPVLR